MVWTKPAFSGVGYIHCIPYYPCLLNTSLFVSAENGGLPISPWQRWLVLADEGTSRLDKHLDDKDKGADCVQFID